ncbi:MAG TPA: hypothetical protein VGW58_08555 [Pyrinomonadaceae bacterium]|nr:hypothetical protein [Pyrinomonadaceae bacterium]
MQPSLTVFALVFVGMLIGRGCRRVPPPLIIERAASGPTQSATTQSSTTQSATPLAASQPSPALDEIYTCGARTKKGTPCSRRVHGPVRCWQHKGAPAMLPLGKLRIKE